ERELRALRDTGDGEKEIEPEHQRERKERRERAVHRESVQRFRILAAFDEPMPCGGRQQDTHLQEQEAQAAEDHVLVAGRQALEAWLEEGAVGEAEEHL